MKQFWLHLSITTLWALKLQFATLHKWLLKTWGKDCIRRIFWKKEQSIAALKPANLSKFLACIRCRIREVLKKYHEHGSVPARELSVVSWSPKETKRAFWVWPNWKLRKTAYAAVAATSSWLLGCANTETATGNRSTKRRITVTLILLAESRVNNRQTGIIRRQTVTNVTTKRMKKFTRVFETSRIVQPLDFSLWSGEASHSFYLSVLLVFSTSRLGIVDLRETSPMSMFGTSPQGKHGTESLDLLQEWLHHPFGWRGGSLLEQWLSCSICSWLCSGDFCQSA